MRVFVFIFCGPWAAELTSHGPILLGKAPQGTTAETIPRPTSYSAGHFPTNCHRIREDRP